MNGMTKEEKGYKERVVRKCWEYLNDNFHKFSEANKLRVSLELVKKDMPTHVEGLESLQSRLIVVYPSKEEKNESGNENRIKELSG